MRAIIDQHPILDFVVTMKFALDHLQEAWAAVEKYKKEPDLILRDLAKIRMVDYEELKAGLKIAQIIFTLTSVNIILQKGETDNEVNKKIKAALSESLTVVLCVGEPAKVHAKGVRVTKKFIEGQIKKALSRIKPSKKLIVAYEPIWAICTKKPDTPEDSTIIASHIKNMLLKMGWGNIKVLYGGSVDSKNAKGFLAENNIDGLLVGMASIDGKEFNKIIKVNG